MAAIIKELTLAPGDRIPGTRISVFTVYLFVLSDTPRESIKEALTLSDDELDFALAYIELNRDEVQRGHEQIEADIARGNPPEVEEKLRAGQLSVQRMIGWIAASRRWAGPADGTSNIGEPGGADWLRREIAAYREWNQHFEATQTSGSA